MSYTTTSYVEGGDLSPLEFADSQRCSSTARAFFCAPVRRMRGGTVWNRHVDTLEGTIERERESGGLLLTCPLRIGIRHDTATCLDT